jgi:chromosome segregation ATPase
MKAYQDEALERLTRQHGIDAVVAELLREHDARLDRLEAAKPAAPVAQPVAAETPRERDNLRCVIADLTAQCKEARRDRDEARAEVERLNNTLSMVRSVAKSYETQCQQEREAGREEALAGIAKEFQGRANGISAKSVLFYAEDIAHFARNWKPAQEVKP